MTKAQRLKQEEDAIPYFLLDEEGNSFLLFEESEYVTDKIEIHFPDTVVPEETTFTARVYFRAASVPAASIPTTIHYRIDCLTTKREIVDWTLVAVPAAWNDITITDSHNQILGNRNRRERKQLLIKVDNGLSTQLISSRSWMVDNLCGIT